MMSVQLDLLQVSDAFSILRTVQNCDFSFAFVAKVLKLITQSIFTGEQGCEEVTVPSQFRITSRRH